eukprot:sb/3464201/
MQELNRFFYQSLLLQSDPDLPGCSGKRVLPCKLGCPVYRGQIHTVNFLDRGKFILPVHRGSGKSGSDYLALFSPIKSMLPFGLSISGWNLRSSFAASQKDIEFRSAHRNRNKEFFGIVMMLLLLLLVSSLVLVHSQNKYTVGDGDYSYVIDYDQTEDDFEIIMPSCGREIDQMDVQQISKPNQIRISFTGDPTEMSLTWTTNDVSHLEEVRYGVLEGDLNNTATSISHQYNWNEQEDGSYVYTSGFIHEALMVNLVPGAIHFYQIFSNGQQSDVMRFIAAPEAGSDAPVSFFHIGDHGTFGTSLMVTADMMKRAKDQDFHGLIHCGDISYANKFNGSRGEPPMASQVGSVPKGFLSWCWVFLNPAYSLMSSYSDNDPPSLLQQVWDTWGQMVEPLGSKMAYMVTPGNHELDPYDSTKENATIYRKRFIMPGNERYYSFGVGMVHFIADIGDIDTWCDRTRCLSNPERDQRGQRDVAVGCGLPAPTHI